MFKSRHLDQLGSKGDFAPFFYSKNGGRVSLLPRFRKKPRIRYHLFAGALAYQEKQKATDVPWLLIYINTRICLSGNPGFH